MNTLTTFFLDVVLTILVVASLVAYFRPHLQRILVDLCAGEDRARFWAVFASILLIGLPTVSALSYLPMTGTVTDSILDLARQFSRNIMTFLGALAGLGLVVSFFALVAPRPRTEKPS
ncbi:MAG TPA: hypothetical protein VF784_03055 [Anaerolineales bacterium]